VAVSSASPCPRAINRSGLSKAVCVDGRCPRVRELPQTPEARAMKMADGGFRPAYNVQFASDTQSGAVAGVAIDSNGSDMGKMAPMNEALAENYGERPRQHLADGGYTKFDDIEALEKAGVEVYAPIPTPRDKNRDRYAAARRCASHRRSAGAHGLESGKRHLQGAGGNGGMHERASAKSWPAAVSRAGCLQGQIDRALAWPDPQHGVRRASHCGLILNSARKGARAPRIDRRSGDHPV
jgi:hypothetical protein